MAREHHCPNCGPQACNASTSKIHTCGVCAAIWEEDLSVTVPVPARPAATSASSPAPASPAPTAAAAPKPAVPANPTTPSTPRPAAPTPPKPVPPSPTPAAPAPAKPVAPMTAPAASKLSAPAAKPTLAHPGPATAKGSKTLADAVQAAKVKRCPKCVSDSLAAPLDFLEAQGRIVLVDSQTYRGHQWFADTGELYAPPAQPAPAPPSPKPASPTPSA